MRFGCGDRGLRLNSNAPREERGLTTSSWGSGKSTLRGAGKDGAICTQLARRRRGGGNHGG